MSGFPDFIDAWNERKFMGVGVAAVAAVAGSWGVGLVGTTTAAVLALPVAGYWFVGLNDMNQNLHTIRKNFPVLGNMRYIFESLRPEIRQYFVESDHEKVLFSRFHRRYVPARRHFSSNALVLIADPI